MEEVLNDVTLSLKAKGLYAIMYMKKFEGITLDSLCELSTDGRDSTKNARKQLEKKGYLKKERVRDGGRFYGTKWIFTKEAHK